MQSKLSNEEDRLTREKVFVNFILLFVCLFVLVHFYLYIRIFFFNFWFDTGVELINNVALVSGVPQSDSVMHIPVSVLSQILFPFGLLHYIEQSSLCYTVGPCWLSVLNIAVCTCPPPTTHQHLTLIENTDVISCSALRNFYFSVMIFYLMLTWKIQTLETFLELK